MILKLFFHCGFLLAVLVTVDKAATADSSLGPFLPNPALTIYLVNDRPMTAVQLSIKPMKPDDRWMVRVFDTEENLSFWRYVEPASAPLEKKLSLKERGVHQIRVTSGEEQCTVSVSLSRPIAWGVSFQNGTFRSWKGQPATLYAFVPPHAEEMEFSNISGSMRVTDENSKELINNLTNGSAIPKISVSKTEVVWRFDFAKPGDWSFRAAGFPLILCPTPEAARAIRASVEVLPDGTVVCHKFQRRIRELLPGLLSESNVGVAETLITPLSSRVDEWVKDPFRNRNLLWDMMPSIAPTLRQQNIDPTSHWAGSFGDWATRVKLPSPQDRWDRLRSVEGLDGGLSPRNSAAEDLARAALLDAPINPYFGKNELLFRATAAALADLLTVGEDEVWRGIGSDLVPYPGFMAFLLASKTPVFALAAPRMPKEVQAVWFDGLRHVVDRHFPDKLTTARNQSSHHLVSFQCFAEGCGDARYKELAQTFAKRFAAGQHPSGFQSEELGPDATYIGMTHWHEAVYYRHSKNPVILDSLRRSYRFFNHTVAPESNGKMLGGFNFSHRTGGGFDDEQWGGAKGILDDVLPEVGLWAPPEPTAEQTSQAASGVARSLAEDGKPSGNNIFVPRYYYWSRPDRSGVWPANEKASFVREFGGQLVAVKRPAYYAAIYVGKPSEEVLIRKREDFRSQSSNNGEENGGEIDFRKITPFLGGGLSLLWTPDYGNSVLAANWSPTTHHGLVATTTTDGKRYWEDYFATNYQLDPRAGTLEISGRIEKQQLVYVRSYRFANDSIEVRVKIKAEQAVSLESFVENVPVVRGSAKSRGTEIETTGNGFRIRDNDDNGVEFVLNQAQPIRIQPNGLRHSKYGEVLQIGRVEIELPSKLSAGQETMLTYTIRPLQSKVSP